VQLCDAEPEAYAARTASVAGSQLQQCAWAGRAQRRLALLEALAALGGGAHSPRALLPALPALMRTLAAANAAHQ
jgi:hypothetical protein